MKKKLIWTLALTTLLIGGIAAVRLSTTHVDPPTPTTYVQPVAPTKPDIATIATLVNTGRTKAGLQPLTEDPRLDASSQAHCADMVRLNEWGHNLSDGTTPQTFISQVIPNWHHSGENTTWGWNTSASVVSHLMNSPEHKANLLSTDYTLVGYAYCETPTYPNIVIQEFAGF